jgi:hypothetical protein
MSIESYGMFCRSCAVGGLDSSILAVMCVVLDAELGACVGFSSCPSSAG